uniref:Uncharacterized protein n=1 Tax=Arundo donax TaxID=35708 RepID=A0A0A9HX93_ARUDO
MPIQVCLTCARSCYHRQVSNVWSSPQWRRGSQ